MNLPPPPKKLPNRRGSERRLARRSIRLECRRGSMGLGANLARGYLDISLSGVQVLTKDLLKCGEEVEIVLEGNGFRGVIRRMGEVRWTVPIDGGGCRAGVRFQKYLSYRELQNLAS